MKKSNSNINLTEGKLLTDTELELMHILWSLGEGSVTEVMTQLPSERNLAYTSVSTILRILEQKKIVKTRKEGRGHIYIPILEKETYEATSIKHVVSKVFNNTPIALVRQLLGSVKLDDQELKELKDLIEKAGDQN